MLLYRLAYKRIIEYFKLDTPSVEEQRLILLHRKPKPVYKTVLKTNQTLNLYVSVLLSIIGMLICITIPFAALEKPCEVFLDNEMHITYYVAKWIEEHLFLVDCLIIFLILILLVVSANTVFDAIKNTNISISPWVERGRYTLPKRRTRFRSSKQ